VLHAFGVLVGSIRSNPGAPKAWHPPPKSESYFQSVAKSIPVNPSYRSTLMVRFVACALALAGLFFVAGGMTEVSAQAKKAQMVKGTIKEVQLDKDVLTVNQKVKNEFVDRELS